MQTDDEDVKCLVVGNQYSDEGIPEPIFCEECGSLNLTHPKNIQLVEKEKLKVWCLPCAVQQCVAAGNDFNVAGSVGHGEIKPFDDSNSFHRKSLRNFNKMVEDERKK